MSVCGTATGRISCQVLRAGSWLLRGAGRVRSLLVIGTVYGGVLYSGLIPDLLMGAVPAEEPVTESGELPPAADEIPWDEVVRELVLLLFPDEVKGQRNWGRRTEVFAGFRLQNGRLQPRERRVNHGLWQRYTFSLIRPRETFRLSIDRVEEVHPGIFEADWQVQLRGRCTVTVAQWTWGVKGFNTTTESDVTIRARVRSRLRVEPMLDPETFLPRLRVSLQLLDLELRLTDLDLRRVGAIGGWVAQEIGNGQRGFIEDILRSQQDRIRRRLQEKIDKKLD